MVTPARSIALIAALALTACGKPAAPAEPAGPTAPPAVPTPAGMKSCVAADLTLKRIGEDAGAGQRQIVYSLTNSSAAPCYLQGIPDASWYGADGKALDGVAMQPNTSDAPYARIEIQPGARAAFGISYTGIQATDKACVSSKTMRLTPPGDTGVIELGDQIDPCTDHVTLNPVREASADDDSLSFN